MPAQVFVRTCQECGHRVVATDPKLLKGGMSEAYRNRACPKCKSEAFDYGSLQWVNADLSHADHDYTKDD